MDLGTGIALKKILIRGDGAKGVYVIFLLKEFFQTLLRQFFTYNSFYSTRIYSFAIFSNLIM